MEQRTEVNDQPGASAPARREWQAPVVVDLLDQPRGEGGPMCLPGSSNVGICQVGVAGLGT